jgi:hypothetical protein
VQSAHMQQARGRPAPSVAGTSSPSHPQPGLTSRLVSWNASGRNFRLTSRLVCWNASGRDSD